MMEIDTLEEERQGIQTSRTKYQVIQEEMQVSEKVVENLNASAGKMEYTKNNILDNLESLASVAKHEATVTEEVSASTNQQAVGVGEMTKTSLELSQLALEMQEVIQKFKID